MAYSQTTHNHLDTDKTKDHVGAHWAADLLEGGEDISSAIAVTSLPFTDSGATCDNNDNYDVICPYYGSTSPDVVYTYTHEAASQVLDIDLCGSLYDTKVYVFDSQLHVIACNDDYYYGEACGLWASRIEHLDLIVGEAYYIVIDGYGGDCGQYTLTISGINSETVVCPPEGLPENEPELVDYYEDPYNGGCNSNPPAFQPLEISGNLDCLTVCGVSGWFFNNGDFRDTDWYEVTAREDEISWSIQANYATEMMVLETGCEGLQILFGALAEPLSPGILVFPTIPRQVYWLWVGPAAFSGPLREFEYVMTVCGITGAVPNAHQSWGAVKTLFR
jgi:hypothetical protein